MAKFDPAIANGIARISLSAKIRFDFLLAAIPSKVGNPDASPRRGRLAGEKHAVRSHVICVSGSISISGRRQIIQDYYRVSKGLPPEPHYDVGTRKSLSDYLPYVAKRLAIA
jgi:hypothetical protein